MKSQHHIKEPGSAITHFIGMLMAIFAAVPLLIKAAHEPSRIYVISLAIYSASMILLYAASTTYHTFDISAKINTILKKWDHMMISVLIAGSYTPICLLVLKGKTGLILLAIVWSFAIVGILIKAFWVYCPKWISSILYIGMGMCSCFHSNIKLHEPYFFFMASDRRNYLYCWRYYLRIKASDF